MSRWDEFPAVMGQVVSLDTDAGVAMVEVDGASVPAAMPDHMWLGTQSGPTVGPGAPVTLLRVVGGYQVVAAFTGAAGGGGPTLGPELVANGGFESGVPGEWPDGWNTFWDYNTGEPNPLATVADSPLAGVQCAQVTLTPGDWSTNTFVNRLPSRISEGIRYRYTVFYMAPRVAVGAGVKVALTLMSAPTEAECTFFQSTAAMTTVATTTTLPGTWTALTGDGTVPTGHTWFRPLVHVTGPQGADATLLLDEVSLRQVIA